jgi:hypothetical protein
MKIFTRYLFLFMLGMIIHSTNSYARINGQEDVTTGKTSTSSSGCGSCHAGSSSSATTVSLTSGSTTVTAGSTNTYTIQVAHSSRTGAGINIAVKTDQTGNTNAGTLSVSESGIQVLGGEISHSARKTMSGGSASFTFSWTAPSTPGTYYLRAIGNAVNSNNSSDANDLWNWMTPIAITVNPSASLTLTSPGSTSNWCAGSPQNITWASSGVANVKIELAPDGTTYSTIAASVSAASGSYSYNVPSGQTVGNQYKIRISDVSNSTLNSVSSAFSVSAAPTITTHPVAQTGCTSQPVTFSVTATGGANTYQWYKDGQQIGNATNSTYTIPSLTAAHAGVYSVVVTGCNTPVTSNTAILTVNNSVVISNSPPSLQTVCDGQNVSLSVTATGTGISYQWKKDGVNISGATDATYNFTASASTSGSYTAVVSGTCGNPQTSSPAAVLTLKAPTITSHPVEQLAVVGSNVSFTVTATDAVSYQWRKNGANIANATTATLNLNNVQMSDAADYSVRVENTCGNIISNTAKLIVGEAGVGAILATNASVNYGTVLPNTDLEKTLVIKNTGDSVLKVIGILITGTNAQNFTVTSGAAPFNLDPNATHELKIKFNGSAVGDYAASVAFLSNSKTSVGVELAAKVALAEVAVIQVNPALNFGTVLVDGVSEKKLVVNNTGNAKLDVSAVTFTGANASSFTIVSGNAPFEVAPGGNMEMTIRFTGATVGNYTATATLTSNGGDPVNVTLSGIVASGISSLNIAATVDFGQAPLNVKLTRKVTITNPTANAIMVNSAVIEGANASLFTFTTPFSPVSIAAGESLELNIDFMPTTEMVATATLNITAADGALSATLTGEGKVQVSVETPREYVSEMRISPNPASEHALVNIIVENPANAEVFVVDVHGKIIRTLSEFKSLEAGPHTFMWNRLTDSGLKASAGMYRIVLRGTGGIVSVPVVVAD